MGFLDKYNPRATRETVICAAIIGAGSFFLLALLMLFRSDLCRLGLGFHVDFHDYQWSDLRRSDGVATSGRFNRRWLRTDRSN